MSGSLNLNGGGGVAAAGGSTGTAITASNSENRYEVITAFTGAKVGDIIKSVRSYNVATGGLIAEVWENVTADATLNTAPSLANLKPSAGTAAPGPTNPTITQVASTSPDVVALGAPADTPAAQDASGSVSLIAAAKRMILELDSLIKLQPVLTTSGRLPVDSGLKTWDTVIFKLDTNGVVVYEKQSDGAGGFRERTWTYNTDAQGVTTYNAGTWV